MLAHLVPEHEVIYAWLSILTARSVVHVCVTLIGHLLAIAMEEDQETYCQCDMPFVNSRTIFVSVAAASLLTPSFSLMNGSEVPLAGSLLPDSAENVMFCAEVSSTTAFQVLVDFVVSIDIARSGK